jgi:protein-tyrosine phosphatase
MLDILFVCTGNLCRSPMAEALFQSKLTSDYPGLTSLTRVHSAGTSAIEDNPATSSAVQAMDLWDVDLEPHRASELTINQLRDADIVMTMAREHLLSIERMYPKALQKSTTLKHIASLSEKVVARLGEETVQDEGEARRRLASVLELLRDAAHTDGFLADIQSRSSDIIDPIGSSLQVYLGVAEDIESSLDKVMRALFGRPETAA